VTQLGTVITLKY